MTISCYHHQAIAQLGKGLHAIAHSHDGVIEAVESPASKRQWFVGVQWHPEDTADADPAQHALFGGLVDAAANMARAR